MLTNIDKLVQELIAKQNAEDISTYAHFFPGIITEEGKLIEQEVDPGKEIQTESAEEHKKIVRRNGATRQYRGRDP